MKIPPVFGPLPGRRYRQATGSVAKTDRTGGGSPIETGACVEAVVVLAKDAPRNIFIAQNV
jgi:hypothetical protein